MTNHLQKKNLCTTMVAFSEVFWPADHFRSSAPLRATPPPPDTPSLLNCSCSNLGPTKHTKAGVHKQCQSPAAWTSLASLSTVQDWQHVTQVLCLPCTQLLKVWKRSVHLSFSFNFTNFFNVTIIKGVSTSPKKGPSKRAEVWSPLWRTDE